MKPKRKYTRNPIPRQKVELSFKPDFLRVKQYDRKYINLPYDTVTNDNFLSLNPSIIKFFTVLGLFSFERAESDGWFPVSMEEIEKRAHLSENTIREAKNTLVKLHFLDVGMAYRKNSNIHYCDCYRLNGFTTMVTQQSLGGSTNI